jgi:hypothetical protein
LKQGQWLQTSPICPLLQYPFLFILFLVRIALTNPLLSRLWLFKLSFILNELAISFLVGVFFLLVWVY